MDARLVTNAASHSLEAYGPFPNQATHIRTVEQFQPAGEFAALVTLDSHKKEVYVAFRGTELLGNWRFTNFQAFFSPLSIVDDSLSASPSIPLQGGSYRLPFAGSAHQGFSRAFTWLWYGTDPLLGISEADIAEADIAVSARWRILRHGTIIALPLLIWLLALPLRFPFPLAVALLIALLLSLAVVGVERGTWEALHRRKPSTCGRALHELLPELNQHDVVIFTGHSLGGAVATIAFAIYRLWCRSSSQRRDNAQLITFGAPRVGDQRLVTAFEHEHADRFVHVVNRGDPVPEMPPRRPAAMLAQRFWLRSPLGLLLTALSPLWSLYAFFYRLHRPGEWSEENVCLTGTSPGALRFSNHSMEGYRDAVNM